jgi:hypothetical protein
VAELDIVASVPAAVPPPPQADRAALRIVAINGRESLNEVRILSCPRSCGMENSAAWIDSGYREKLNDVRKNSLFEQKDSEKQQNIVGKVTVVVNKYLTVFN